MVREWGRPGTDSELRTSKQLTALPQVGVDLVTEGTGRPGH